MWLRDPSPCPVPGMLLRLQLLDEQVRLASLCCHYIGLHASLSR